MQKLSVVRNSALNSFFTQSAIDSGNWVRTKLVQLNGSALDITINDLDGDVDKYAMIKLSGKNSEAASLQVQIGGASVDTTAANYSYVRHYKTNDGSVSAANGVNSYNNTGTFCYLPISTVGASGEIVIDLASGKQRAAHAQGMTTGIGGSAHVVDGTWLNTTTNINSLRVLSTNGLFTGTLEIYKWRASKVSTLASYEIVKEYNLVNQTLNDTFAYDGEAYPDLVILADFSSAGTPWLGLRPNGDTGTNYGYGGVWNNGSSGAIGSAASNQPAMYVTDSGSKVNARFQTNLKAGSRRVGVSIMERETNTIFGELVSSVWTNSTSAVTSLNLYSSGAITGNIKVCRLVTTQLLNQYRNPIQLVVNQTYNNQPVDITLDLTDCDGIEIEGACGNNAGPVGVYLNGDQTASNYAREIFYAYSGAPGGVTQLSDYNTIGCMPVGTAGQFALKLNNYSKTVLLDYGYFSSTNWYKGSQFIKYVGTNPVTSVRLYSGGVNVTGKLKVWKKY